MPRRNRGFRSQKQPMPPTFADAILFTFDAISPSVVPLRTTSSTDSSGSRVHQPHPEDYIEAYWSAQTIVNLPRLSVALGNPYVVFFQPTQKDLPLNAPIMSLITAAAARDPPSALPTNVSHIHLWRGNVLVAKYADVPFGEMISCGINDLPIISSHLRCHEPSENELDI